MKRTRTPRRARMSANADALIRLATSYAEAGSKLEDQFWEMRLSSQIDQMLDEDDEADLNTVLDHLYNHSAPAFNALADLIDSRCETRLIVDGKQALNVLLIAIPILAWSRFAIPSGKLIDSVLETVRVHLQAHVCASNTQLALADILFSPDQLPQGFCETARLTDKLGKQALLGKNLHIDPSELEETLVFLSDSRYLLAAIVAPQGQAMFRWQEDDGNREEAMRQWRTQGGAGLRIQLTACASEFLLPQAFFAACRDTDQMSRPYALHASVAFLNTLLNVPPQGLRAVVAPFYEDQLEEYRIGFTLTGSNEVIHGVVWPLLETEDEDTDVLEQIEAALRDAGTTDILILDNRFPLEFCDDCGAPLYPNPEGEPVHAELPEEQAEPVPKHLH